jgi:hypothetical protein
VLESNIEKMQDDLFKCITVRNFYEDTCFANLKKDENSFYHLLTRDISHSDAIKLGIAVEKIFRELILTNDKVTDIRPKNKKDVKEKDHLFLKKVVNASGNIENHIYYAEVKANLNLDTEKTIATIAKIKSISDSLRGEYPDVVSFNPYLFAPRYYTTSLIPANYIDKFKGIEILGVNEYLAKLDVEYQFKDEQHYKDCLNYLVHRMFECVNYANINEDDLKKTAIGESITPPRVRIAKSRLNGDDSNAHFGTPMAPFLRGEKPVNNTLQPMILNAKFSEVAANV